MSESQEWNEFEYRPPTGTTAAALSAAFVATVALAAVQLSLSVGAAIGGFLLAVGLSRGSHTTVTVGAGVMFGALCLVVVTGGGVLPVLVAAAGTLVAYDAGRYGVRLGEQMGAEGPATAAVVSHVGQTAGLTAAGTVVVAVVYYVSPAQQPELAVVVLLLAVVVLVSVLVLSGSEG